MNSFFGGFQYIISWIQGIPHGFKVYYPETNSLVFVHQREYRVRFFQAFKTLVSDKKFSLERRETLDLVPKALDDSYKDGYTNFFLVNKDGYTFSSIE